MARARVGSVLAAVVVALVALCACAAAAPSADRINGLPGWAGALPVAMWSGFLNATAADPVAAVQLHYWYCQSSSADPSAVPLVLWLNGGPGSSSLLGLLQEHGPLLVNATGGLMLNPYAWTQQVNLLVIESPSGVGYSYCANSLTGGGCNNTDVTTARAARFALQDFFVKFPELRSLDFFITGESYAGVYVPTLSKEVLDNAPEIRLKGLAVGDPCTDNDAQRESMDMLWYGHKNGFVPDDEFDLLWTTCRARHPHPLMGPADHSKAANGVGVGSFTMEGSSRECVIAQRKYLAATSKGFSQTWVNAYINNLSLYGPSALTSWDQPGSLNYLQAQWMMRADVRRALHVDRSPHKVWPGPGPLWGYTKVWAACNADAKPGTASMIDFYRDIAPRLRTTIVFNGDTDPCVSYEGTRIAIQRVGFAEMEGGAYRPWFFNATATSDEFLHEKPLLFGPALSLDAGGPQFGGHVVNYAHNLSFITVHGSGHMIPQFRPQGALQLLRSLVTGLPLAAPLPSDDEIAVMSDDKFDAVLDDWVEAAKANV